MNQHCTIIERFIEKDSRGCIEVLCSCRDWDGFMEGYIKFRNLTFNTANQTAIHKQWILKVGLTITYNDHDTPIKCVHKLAQAIVWYNQLSVPNSDCD